MFTILIIPAKLGLLYLWRLYLSNYCPPLAISMFLSFFRNFYRKNLGFLSQMQPSLFGLLLGSVLLAGCQKQNSMEVLPVIQPIADTTAVKADNREEARLKMCQQELDVLKSLPGKSHEIYKSHFNRMMGSAAQYSGLRGKVSEDTQDTLDALYRYHASLLCQEIHHKVITGLAARGEGKL